MKQHEVSEILGAMGSQFRSMLCRMVMAVHYVICLTQGTICGMCVERCMTCAKHCGLCVIGWVSLTCLTWDKCIGLCDIGWFCELHDLGRVLHWMGLLRWVTWDRYSELHNIVSVQ